MMAVETRPAAWIGSLAAYNAGRLVGAWIDLEGKDTEEVTAEAIEAMRPQIAGFMSEAEAFEELWVFDHEYLSPLVTGECGIVEAVKAAEILTSLEDDEREPFRAYAENIGAAYADVGDFREAFNGEWNDEEDFARELMQDIGEIQGDSLAERYFDWESFTRDLFMSDYYSMPAPGGMVYVFRNI